MANTFVRYQSRNVGTSLTKIGAHTVAAATNEIVIGLVVTNQSGADITYDLTVNDGTNDFYLAKGATLVAGGSQAVFGKNKQVLTTGDSIQVKGSAGTGIDATLSVLQIT